MKRIISAVSILAVLTVHAQSYTARNGRLHVKGTQLCNQAGGAVQLKGFSTHNITYCPECVTYDAVKSNRDFWGANVIRATVYTDDFWNKESYNNNPKRSKDLVDSLVRWSEELGIYCIIDWHILTQGNPNAKIHAGADAFFQEMSLKYADKPHVLYEICNEPNGNGVTWDSIADYANRIIPIIRKNSPQSVIIVGTPQWCQLLGSVQPSKLVDSVNVMYAFHFYAASHAGLLPMFLSEIHRIPVFATEWGVCESTGNGNVNYGTAEKYLDAMYQHIAGQDTVRVSWCNFSYGDLNEAAAALKPRSCTDKKWENMSPTGLFVRDYMQAH